MNSVQIRNVPWLLLLILGVALGVGASSSAAPSGVDAAFSGDGIVGFQLGSATTVSRVLVQIDDAAVLVGTTRRSGQLDPGVARVTSSGDADITFGGGDGRVVWKLGSRDDVARDALLQPDGSIVIVGDSVLDGQGRTSSFIARLQPDGTVDPGFSDDGAAVLDLVPGRDEFVNAVARQSDGSLLICGVAIVPASGRSAAFVTRFLADGELDTTFGSGGTVILDGSRRSADAGVDMMVVSGDAVLLAVHHRAAGSRRAAPRLVRLASDGTLDSTFSSDGIRDLSLGSRSALRSMALTADPTHHAIDGSVLVAMTASTSSGTRVSVRRILVDGSTDPAYVWSSRRVSRRSLSGSVAITELADGSAWLAAPTDLLGDDDSFVAHPSPTGTISSTDDRAGYGIVDATPGVLDHERGVDLALDSSSRPIVATSAIVSGRRGAGTRMLAVRLNGAAGGGAPVTSAIHLRAAGGGNLSCGASMASACAIARGRTARVELALAASSGLVATSAASVIVQRWMSGRWLSVRERLVSMSGSDTARTGVHRALLRSLTAGRYRIRGYEPASALTQRSSVDDLYITIG